MPEHRAEHAGRGLPESPPPGVQPASRQEAGEESKVCNHMPRPFEGHQRAELLAAGESGEVTACDQEHPAPWEGLGVGHCPHHPAPRLES